MLCIPICEFCWFSFWHKHRLYSLKRFIILSAVMFMVYCFILMILINRACLVTDLYAYSNPHGCKMDVGISLPPSYFSLFLHVLHSSSHVLPLHPLLFAAILTSSCHVFMALFMISLASSWSVFTTYCFIYFLVSFLPYHTIGPLCFTIYCFTVSFVYTFFLILLTFHGYEYSIIM